MDTNSETFETWNNIASLYQDKFMDLVLYNETYEYFCRAVTKQNAKILEIGCGPGNITRYLLKKNPDWDVLGIDIAPNMIKLAKNNNPTAKFEVMDARQIMELDNRYDGIVAGFCLPYLAHDESMQFISNAYELLNPYGIFYLSFVEGSTENSGFKVGSGGRVYFHYHDLDELRVQLMQRKFNEIETFRVNYPTSENEFEKHTVLVARKGNSL